MAFGTRYIARVSGEAFDADQIEVPCDCGYCPYGQECAYDRGPDLKPLTYGSLKLFGTDEAKRMMLRFYGIKDIDGWLLAEAAALEAHMARKDAA